MDFRRCQNKQSFLPEVQSGSRRGIADGWRDELSCCTINFSCTLNAWFISRPSHTQHTHNTHTHTHTHTHTDVCKHKINRSTCFHPAVSCQRSSPSRARIIVQSPVTNTDRPESRDLCSSAWPHTAAPPAGRRRSAPPGAAAQCELLLPPNDPSG